MDVRELVNRASICQARVWDRSVMLASYIAGEVVKTNHGFCKAREGQEIEAKINANGHE